MKKQVNNQTLALIGSFIFLFFVVIGFGWLFLTSKPSDSNIVLSETYNTVEIGSLKSQAQSLIQSKGNLVQMPITTPVSGVGKTNPFAGN